MNKLPRYTILLMMSVVMIVPMIPLLGWAFSTGWKFPNMLPANFTMETFLSIFKSNVYVEALVNSVILSTLVMLISLLIGFHVAKALGVREFRGRRFLEIFILLPALTPAIALVFGMRNFFIDIGMFKSYWSLVLAQVTFTIPYMVMLLTPVFRNYDTDYEKQSATLGVGKLNTALHVTMPAIKPGLVVACMYTFIVSWSIYLFTYYLMPPSFKTMTTLLMPMISVNWTDGTVLAAMTLLFILPAFIVFAISSRMLGKNGDSGQRPGP